MFGSSNPFGQSSNSPFGSPSVFGQNNNPNNNPFSAKPFGSTSPFGSQTGSSIFGGTSTGVFGTPASSPVFGASSSPAFGSSVPAFGASSSPAFGASSSFGGSSVFGQKPAFGGFGSTAPSSPFGSSFQQSQPAFGSNLFGSSSFGASSQPAFGTPSTPAFGASSTPAFGATSTPAFGATSTPAFGAPSTPAFGSTSTPTFGNTGSAFGTSVFGSSTSAFGASSTPAFGASSTPAFGASSTPAFGASSTPAFGASSTPLFGSSPAPAFGSTSTRTFGNTGFTFGNSVLHNPHLHTTADCIFASIFPDRSLNSSQVSSYSTAGASPATAPSPTSNLCRRRPPNLRRLRPPSMRSHRPPSLRRRRPPSLRRCVVANRALNSSSFSFWPSPTSGKSTCAFGSSPFGATSIAFGAQSSPFGGQTTTPWPVNASDTLVVSISAMGSFQEKSHEELRWECHQLKNLVGLNHAAQSSGGMGLDMNNTHETNHPFASSSPAANPFSSTTSTNPFVPKNSTFGTESSTPLGSSPFGSTPTTSSHLFGAPSSSPIRSSIPIYGTQAQGTTSAFGTGLNFEKLESISAMSAYKEKSHEELKWEYCQLRNKGDPNPAAQFSGRMDFNLAMKNTQQTNPFASSSAPAFWQSSANPFNLTISTNPFTQKNFNFWYPWI